MKETDKVNAASQRGDYEVTGYLSEHLSEDERKFVFLRYVRGMNFQHIAQVMDIPVYTLRSDAEKINKVLSSILSISPDQVNKEGRIKIKNAPGTRLMPLVRLAYSAKSIEKVFDPIYADFCEEYFAALAAGRKGHARWIQVRYYKDFVKAVSLFGVVRLAKTVFEYWEKIA